MVKQKGVPKRDGSGAGRRLNAGRGGCKPRKNKNAVYGLKRGFRNRY